MGEVDQEKHPKSGATIYRRKDVSRPQTMTDAMWFAPSMTEDVAAEYYVPAASTKALELLRAHGIRMRQLTAPVRGVEQFAITANTARPANASPDFGGHAVRSIEGSWQPASGVDAPAGSWAIAMNQPLAR